MNQTEKHDRNLKILRLSNSGHGPQEIASDVGLTPRQVERIAGDMRARHRQRLRELARQAELTGVGEARPVHALEEMKFSMVTMVDLLQAYEVDLLDAVLEAFAKSTFDEHSAVIEQALRRLPEHHAAT
jgi:hypothetical protein